MFGFDERYTENCRIYNMLKSAPEHISFHTPGHKAGKWDITELAFSDNLSAPSGVLKEAQEDIARILGSDKAFILTDGSTSGVLSMLRASGVKKLLFAECSHKSVYNGCALMGIEPVIFKNGYLGSVPQQPAAEAIEELLVAHGCDGVLLTSPDYYGNVADWQAIKAVCSRHGAVLLCDGAHGSHLHGTALYGGNYCDLWVDGVHKNLPCFTQGAVVSANGKYAEALERAVDIFRTTSPNYLLMASVEYAVKYPRNGYVERRSMEIKQKYDAYPNADWSKIVLHFGTNAFSADEYLQRKGVYAEFCDGANVMFYLSPVTTEEQLRVLENALDELTPLRQKDGGMSEGKRGKKSETRTWVPLSAAEGRTAAQNAGLFPPCIPLVVDGDKITAEQAQKLLAAKNTYGLKDKRILVYDDER